MSKDAMERVRKVYPDAYTGVGDGDIWVMLPDDETPQYLGEGWIDAASRLPVVADGPAEGIATRVFDEKLHACSLSCDCKKRGQFPCNTCQAAWHQAWDLVEGKIVKPVEPAAPVVQPKETRPFYENSECAICNAKLCNKKSFAIPAGLAGSKQIICESCAGQSQPAPVVVSRLEEFEERIRFERWYAANRMGIYMRYGTRLRMAIEDTARASWFEGKRLALTAQPAPLPSSDKPYPLLSDEWLEKLAPGVLIAGRVQSAHMAQELQQWRKYGKPALPSVQKETTDGK